MLTKEDLTNRYRRAPETVALPSGEWLFRKWHGTERDIWEQAVDANKLDDEQVSLAGLKALAVVLSLCNEVGEMLYLQSTAAERDASAKEVNDTIPHEVIDEIYREALRRYVGRVADEKKDSEQVQS